VTTRRALTISLTILAAVTAGCGGGNDDKGGKADAPIRG